MEQPTQKPGGIRSVADLGAVIGLATMTVLVFVSVILRYLFAISFRWSDELTRYIFIYVVFLGIPIAYRHGDHIVIELGTRLLPGGLRRWLAIPVHAAIGILMAIMGVAGLWITFGKMGRALTPGLQIPRAYMQAAFPLGVLFLLMEVGVKLKQALGRGRPAA